MSDRDLDPDQKRLVFRMIVDVLDSFEKLEVIVALDRAGRPLSLADLARAASLDDRLIGDAADGLVADAVVTCASDLYRLDRTGPWGPKLDALLALYRGDRLEVVTMMSKASLERMRERAARAFADAFVIRKKGQHDG